MREEEEEERDEEVREEEVSVGGADRASLKRGRPPGEDPKTQIG